MKVRKKNNVGKLEEIQETGETVYTEENSIRRNKISQESRDTQKTAITNGNTQKRIENLEEILFGKDIHK